MVSTLTRVDVSLDAESVYVILDELYQGVCNEPQKLIEIITMLEKHLEDAGLPVDRDTYDDEIGLTHPENEQYKRLTYWLDAEREDKNA